MTTPKQLIAGMVQSKSGKESKGANRITLLRRGANGEWEKHVFIDHLHSPFGMQLIGDTLYVADTDAILKSSIAEQGVELTDLPDTVNHHWTKVLLASRDGKKLYVGEGSNSNVGENELEVEYRRAPCSKSISRRAEAVSSPRAFAIRPACNGSHRQDSCGRSPTSAMKSARIWCRTI